MSILAKQPMQVQHQISLKPYNTFHVEAMAARFATFRNTEDLSELIAENTGRPVFVLGGGSNILLTKDMDELVLKNEITGIRVVKEDFKSVYVSVGAGENWHRFVQYCLQRNWAGVENLSLIPGSVGAAPIQNIGAYGVELKEVFYELEAYSLADKRVYAFSLNDCEFGYRDSIFKRKWKGQYIILNVTLRLFKQPGFHTSYGAVSEELKRMGVKELSIQAISQAICNIRNSKLPDPNLLGNAGSFFKNPTVSASQFETMKQHVPGIIGYVNPDGSVKLAAGWLIEQCGWKGFREGDAGCHEKQALVLVNYGSATGKQILDIADRIQQSVKEKFDVVLEKEVNVF